MSETKRCNLCGETKPLADYYPKPDGTPRARCKVCLRADSRGRDPDYYKKNPEGCKAKVRRWIERNRPKYNKIMSAAVKRSRRKKRERGTGLLPLDDAPKP